VSSGEALRDLRPPRCGIDEQLNAWLDSRSGRARRAGVAVQPGLEVALKVVVQERRDERHERVKTEDDHESLRLASFHEIDHDLSIDTSAVTVPNDRASVARRHWTA
jgi:hypothetical protein